MCQMILPVSSLVCLSCWQSSSSVSAKHNKGAIVCHSECAQFMSMEDSLMPKVSSQPDIAALAEPSEATTHIGIKERLPRIGEFVRQQGALIALIIVVTFSFLRY